MAVTTSKTNKPILPRGADVRPIDSYNRAELYSGKALDFDGVNDDVRVSGFSLSGDKRSVAFCFKSTQNDNGRLFSIVSGPNRFNATFLYGNLNTYDGINGINTDLSFNDGQIPSELRGATTRSKSVVAVVSEQHLSLQTPLV